MLVIKRNGNVVDFNGKKIEQAILKAMVELDMQNSPLAKKIVKEISKELNVEKSNDRIDVEKIQDIVEEKLMQSGNYDLAKAYILYRNQRNKQRSNNGWNGMTDLAKDVMKHKYYQENENFESWLDRVSNGNEEVRSLIKKKKFIFGGRILANRGINKNTTLSNCYVLTPPEDNIESIFETAGKLARTFSYGGGVGFSLEKLRPKGSKVNNAAKTTTGAVSFMDLYSLTTGLIGQAGRRK